MVSKELIVIGIMFVGLMTARVLLRQSALRKRRQAARDRDDAR